LIAYLNQCGLSKQQIYAVEAKGHSTPTDFSLYWYKVIKSFAKKLQAHLVNLGEVNLGRMHVVHLKAFLYWLQNRKRQGIDLYDDYNEAFIQIKLKALIVAYMQYDEEIEDGKESKTKPQTSSNCMCYRVGAPLIAKLENYLASLQGILGVPIIYMIKDRAISDMESLDMIKDLIHHAPHLGPAYLIDKKCVYWIIWDVVTSTDG